MKRDHPVNANPVSYNAFLKIARELELQPEDFARQLGMSKRTLQRRANARSLSQAEQLKASMLLHVLTDATRVLGSVEAARVWVKTSLPVLGFQTPLESLGSIGGDEAVRHVLGRVESGAF